MILIKRRKTMYLIYFFSFVVFSFSAFSHEVLLNQDSSSAPECQYVEEPPEEPDKKKLKKRPKAIKDIYEKATKACETPGAAADLVLANISREGGHAVALDVSGKTEIHLDDDGNVEFYEIPIINSWNNNGEGSDTLLIDAETGEILEVLCDERLLNKRVHEFIEL